MSIIFVSLALLYLLVLIAGITLPGGFHETCVDNLSFSKNQALACHVSRELLEELVISPRLGKRLAILPHRLLIGNVARGLDAKEVTEAQPVQYLVLGVVVCEAVIALQEQDLEHQHRVERLPARIVLAVLVLENLLKHRAEHLEVDHLLHLLKGVAHAMHRIARLVFLEEKVTALHLPVCCLAFHLSVVCLSIICKYKHNYLKFK